MSQHPRSLRFVEPKPRAKTISREKWEEHREELCFLYQRMTLDELMDYMKDKYGFEPSPRQLIYKFNDVWKVKKYNTMGRDIFPPHSVASSSNAPLSESAPGRISADYPARPPVPPKRPKSMGSLQSRDSSGNSVEKPAIPPKKRQKIEEYMANRAQDPFADPLPGLNTSPVTPRNRAAPIEFGSPIQQLATLGMQFASTGQPNPSHTSPFASLSSSPYSLLSSTAAGSGNLLTPGLIEDDSDWATINDHSDTELLLDDFSDAEMIDVDKQPSNTYPRHFDSSRPIHTFSQQYVEDMKMAAHFLRALGFDSDAFELFTILLKQLKASDSQLPWKTKAALIHCARSSCQSHQLYIARNELSKFTDEPRESSTDTEHFLYWMLLSETYSRSKEEENEKFLRDTAMGCELANDRMLDRLPNNHRSYDILTYHYLNKCLEYLNSLEEGAWDKGTIFTDKEQLQIRTVERVPGPFELRRGKMQNPCLKSCLDWCLRVLQPNLQLPDGWPALQSDGQDYLYWVEHIGLYCALWQRWQSQRRDCLGGMALPTWMLETEARMGIHPAELLSVVCGLIMSAAPPRVRSDAHLIGRARAGIRTICQIPDKDLGCQFLETYSLLRALIGSKLQRQYHDLVSFVASIANHGREREAFKQKGCAFARQFLEKHLDCILPKVQEDVESDSDKSSSRFGFLLFDNARKSVESLSWFPTLGGTSEHSSELSAMRRLRDQIEQAAQVARRNSTDRTSAPPSNVFERLASRSQASLPSMCELSRMASSLSLSPSMANRNSYLDSFAAATRDLFQLFTEMEGPFRDTCGDETE